MAERRPDHPVTPPVTPAERRSSARVPLDRPVRIGPPGGYPHASVTARDLSPGGLFIDAERDVRVGARFSVAIPLSTGHDAYVPEAEVVDNRSGTERGFGVRFVKLSSEARKLIEEEVENRAYVSLRSLPVSQEPHAFEAGDLPTFGSMPVPGPAVFDEDVAAANLAMASVLPSAVAKASAPTALVRARTRWMKMKAWLRSLPVLSGLLYFGAVFAVVAVGVLVMLEARPATTPPTVEDLAEAPELHTQLVEGAAPAGLEEAPPTPPGEVVNPLPEKVEAPRTRGFVPRRAGGVYPPRARAGRPDPVEAPPIAPAVVDEGAPESETVPPGASTEPEEAPVAFEEEGAGFEEAPADFEDERMAIEELAAEPEPIEVEAEATSPTRLSNGKTFLSLPVGRKARLRKSYVLRQPERFVVDVIGAPDAPKLPEGRGLVRKVRFGRHDSFSRFVVDADAPIESGQAKVRDGRLELTLRFR